MRNVEVLLILLFLCAAFATIVPVAYCQTDPSDVMNELLSNPITLVVFLIQFGLGLGLGYFSVKALRYIVAIVSIVGLGVLLNIWRFGGLEGFLKEIGWIEDINQMIEILTSIITLLGVLTFLPIGAGFFLGAIAAVIK